MGWKNRGPRGAEGSMAGGYSVGHGPADTGNCFCTVKFSKSWKGVRKRCHFCCDKAWCNSKKPPVVAHSESPRGIVHFSNQ